MSYHLSSAPPASTTGCRVDDLGHVAVVVADRADGLERAHRAPSARAKSMIQLSSHDSPPSAENACSQRGAGVVVRDHVKRTRIGLPVERVLALEDAEAVPERAEDGRVEHAAAAAVGPVDRPLPRARRRRSGTTCRSCRRRGRCGTRPRCRGRRAAGARCSSASNSSHSSDPASRSRRQRLRTVHEPNRKSKSLAVPTAYVASCMAPLLVSRVRREATLSTIEGGSGPLCLLDLRACSRRPRACSSCSSCCRLSRSRPAARSRSGSGIDARTVRRYIAALQALDIPVEGQRGVGGGYRVRPGYRLPPLMLNDDEAVAVVLGLIGARGPSLERRARAGRRRAREDPARPAGSAAQPGRGARADARLHGRDARRGAGRRRRRAAARRRDPAPAARAHGLPLVRRASRRRASSARTASSCTRAAGTWPRSTTAATTCARSASIA